MADEILGPGGKLREITAEDRAKYRRNRAMIWTPCAECGHSWLAHSRSVGCVSFSGGFKGSLGHKGNGGHSAALRCACPKYVRPPPKAPTK